MLTPIITGIGYNSKDRGGSRDGIRLRAERDKDRSDDRDINGTKT